MTAIIIVVCITIKANDGAYLSRGSVIYPIYETKISLEKEILSFKVVDRVSQVNIYFEFFNPEHTERKVLVGFQAPYPSGDLSYRLSSNTLVSDFKVIKDGSILPYKIKYANCENCELTDTIVIKSSEEQYGKYFVYLFEVDFKPGKNVIYHSYDFPASNNVLFGQIYRYILKTGSKWAGGTIKDFTLQIDMGKNLYFYVKDVFPTTAEWTVVGTGKVSNNYSLTNNWSIKMVRVLSGKLEVSQKNFKPTEDLDFGVFLGYSFINERIDKDRVSKNIYVAMSQLTTNIQYPSGISFTEEDLLILRNAVYAQYGYQFKNKDLYKYFSQFEWYIPDPNLTLDKIVLTEKEMKFIDEIIEKSK
jgi:hypothetical protein